MMDYNLIFLLEFTYRIIRCICIQALAIKWITRINLNIKKEPLKPGALFYV